MGSKSIIAIALVSIGAASAEAKPVEQLTGKVVSVTDGDTLRVHITGDRTTIKVRLDSIDAPEKGQPFSAVAKKHLTEIAKGKNCTVRQMGKDKYGRVLGIVTILGTPRGAAVVGSSKLFGTKDTGNLNANKEMVRAGLAWHYIKYSKSKTLAKLEQEARDKKLGLWAAATKPIAPWEWRAMSKEERTLAITGRAAPAQETTETVGDALTHWLNTNTGVRHNSTCRWHGKTKGGRECTADEGKPCDQCGG
jgi:micrococcal nuclease